MCSKCANLENRLPAKRIKAIRETDYWRGSKEHRELVERIRKMARKK